MNRILLYILILVLFVLRSPAMWAGNDVKGDKKKKEVVTGLVEPDPIAHKAKPDRVPRELKQPRLSYVVEKYGVEGFDMSHYQGRIDWEAVATDPKAGYIYLKATEGNNIVDNTYAYNLSMARNAGLKVGSYHFFRGQISAREQFRNFSNTVDRSKQDILPLIDVETMPNNVNKSKFDATLLEFLRLVEKEYGKKPIIYTGKNFYEKHFKGTVFANYKFMIAAYIDQQPVLSDGNDFIMWQYTSSGRANGVRGHVDVSKFVNGHSLHEILY